MDYIAALADLLWRRRWLTAGITWAVLALLFYAEVIFPPVEPSLSPQPITLNSQDYPNLRAEILTLSASSLSSYRQKSASPRRVIDIQYDLNGVNKKIYRCLCAGHWCSINQLENGKFLPENEKNLFIDKITITEILFSNINQRNNYCVINQIEFFQRYQSNIYKVPYLHGTTTDYVNHDVRKENYKASIFKNISSAEFREISHRIYFVTFIWVSGFILGMYFLAWLVKK